MYITKVLVFLQLIDLQISGHSMAARYVDANYMLEDYVNEGIYIDWGTRIIFIPKEETQLVQSTPIEIRQLDVNTFRLALKDLEDSDEGISSVDTHKHNTPVTISGITLARVVEIINNFTITFEDGNYAINVVGGNSNIGDVVNLNKVSVRVANSAGLTETYSLEDIKSALYNDPRLLTVAKFLGLK